MKRATASPPPSSISPTTPPLESARICNVPEEHDGLKIPEGYDLSFVLSNDHGGICLGGNDDLGDAAKAGEFIAAGCRRSIGPPNSDHPHASRAAANPTRIRETPLSSPAGRGGRCPVESLLMARLLIA